MDIEIIVRDHDAIICGYCQQEKPNGYEVYGENDGEFGDLCCADCFQECLRTKKNEGRVKANS